MHGTTIKIIIKMILYYFNTIFFILYYIFPVQMVVLDGNFTLGCRLGTDYP